MHHIRVIDARLCEASGLRSRKAGNDRIAGGMEGLEKRLRRGKPSQEHHYRWDDYLGSLYHRPKVITQSSIATVERCLYCGYACYDVVA